MELRLILTLLQKWAWLLIIGAIIGAAMGYYYTINQVPSYHASTRVMVLSSASDSYYFGRYSTALGEQQLAQSYVSLFTVDTVLNQLSAELGYAVNVGQIQVSKSEDSQIIEIRVHDRNPERVADIANTLVEVFRAYIQEVEAGRFLASEQALELQIQQIQGQIAETENQIATLMDSKLETTLEELELQVAELEERAVRVQSELSRLETPQVSDDTLVDIRSEQRLIEKELELRVLEAQFQTVLSRLTELDSLAILESTDLQGDLTEPSLSNQLDAISNDIVKLTSEIRQLQRVTSIDKSAANELPQSEIFFKRFELESIQNKLNVYQDALLRAQVSGDTEFGGSNSQLIGQLQTRLSLYQQIYAGLLPSYESIRLARLENTTEISQIDLAEVPVSPIQDQSFLLVGMAIALMLAGTIAFIVEYLDDTLKSPSDVDRNLGVTIIGTVLEDKAFEAQDIYVAAHPRTPISEAFRILRTNLEFASVDRQIKTLLISSPQPSEGKSTIATNLAVTFAQSGKNVILVDADLRRPSLHRMFKVNNIDGLTGMLIGKQDTNAIQQTTIENLSIIASGALPPNPSELLGSKRLVDLLEQLKSIADIVILDAPPFVVSDPASLAANADATLLVVESGQTRVGSAQAAIEQLNRANAHVVGVVLNQIPRHGAGYYGYYTYYKYYGVEENNNQNGGVGHRKNRRRSSGNRSGPILGRLRRLTSFFTSF